MIGVALEMHILINKYDWRNIGNTYILITKYDWKNIGHAYTH